MLIAELKGKLPSKLESSEDILTSNVFSFFKYSNRAIYLRKLLSQIGINVTEDDLEKAEFQFWPCYFDGTEPDVVIIVGKYYILVEAKYRSGFGVESSDTEAQLKREMNGGLRVSNEMGKELILVAITADSTFKKWGKGVQSDVINSPCFKWLNWQTVAKVLVELLEKQCEPIDNQSFASDLLELLDKKKLRGFQSFERLQYEHSSMSRIFFSYETAIFRGKFIGFKALSNKYSEYIPSGPCAFYNKLYFSWLKKASPVNSLVANYIFYNKGRD